MNRIRPVRPLQVRFSDAVRVALKREAKREGVAEAQFVREAVVARIAWLEAQRANGPEDGQDADESPS